MENRFRSILLPLIATLGAVMFSAISGALADQICAEIWVDNKTNNSFSTSSNVDGKWTPDTSLGGWATPGVASNPDGSPPGTLAPQQRTKFRSCSSGGLLPEGTGGKLTISGPDVGTLTWSAPWSVANGINIGCGSDVSQAAGFQAFHLSGGYQSEGQAMGGRPWVCLYSFGVTSAKKG